MEDFIFGVDGEIFEEETEPIQEFKMDKNGNVKADENNNEKEKNK